jgi:hypothetical protein
VRKHAKELRKVCKLTPLEQNEQIDEAHGAADIAKAAQWERPGGAFSDPNLQSAASLGLSSEEYDDLDVMPGADFMMKGFDVTNDSVSLYVSNGGETQRLPVYKFTYDNQATYTNPYTKVKYKVADQISPTTNTQAMEFIVQDISYHFSSVQTYETSRFNIGVKFSSENISAGVTYNHQMAKASTIMSNNSHVFAGSKKWWKIFDIAAYPPLLVGGLDPIFVKALDGLPRKIKTDRDKFRYEMFTRAWGTHYISGANFGGKLIHNVYVDTDWYSSQQSSWVSSQISLNFHYDAFDIDGGGFHNKSQIKMDKDYEKHSQSYMFYEGGLTILQSGQTLDDWQESIPQVPHFLNATMAKISELASDYNGVGKTLSNYIDLYMEHAGKPSAIPLKDLF